MELCIHNYDTLRCNFYMAVISAMEKDEKSYAKYRDYCLNDDYLNTISPSARTMFHLIDNIINDTINDKEFEEIEVLSPQEKQEFSNRIMNNTKILMMLLEDILHTSDIDKGQYRITYDEGEVHFMCRAAITSSEHRLQHGVKMIYQPEQEEPFTFRTDPQRIQHSHQPAYQRLQAHHQGRDCPGQFTYSP